MTEPSVGDRFTYDDVEYVINRISVTPSTGRPERLQIDAMTVAEVKRRQANLGKLLDGIAAGGGGTTVREVRS